MKLLDNIIVNKTGYNCGSDVTRHFMQYHYKRLSSQTFQHGRDTFDSNFFLSLLRNKQVAIMGDSLGRQLYHALDTDLAEFQSYGHNGNGTHTSYFYHCNPHKKPKPLCGILEPKPNKYYAAIRKYDAFNTTLLFCNDAKLVTLISDEPFTNAVNDPRCFCGERAIHSDVVIMAVGAWYKPITINMHSIEQYRAVLQRMAIKFRHDITTARNHIAQRSPQSLIIWRNNPQVGRIDELNSMGMNNPKICCPWKTSINRDCCYSHGDGLLWTNKSLSAEWVYRLNKVLEGVAQRFHDPVLDWYTLSLQFIDTFSPQRVRCHTDSLHWCAGGLERAANLLLQDVIEEASAAGL